MTHMPKTCTFQPEARRAQLIQAAQGTCLRTFADTLIINFGCTPDYALAEAHRLGSCPAAERVWPANENSLSLT